MNMRKKKVHFVYLLEIVDGIPAKTGQKGGKKQEKEKTGHRRVPFFG